jgi:KDO2-lipid IV(A) lauroyltransferase
VFAHTIPHAVMPNAAQSAASPAAPYTPPDDWRWDRNPSHGSAALMPIYGVTRIMPRRLMLAAAWFVGTGVAHAFRRTRRVLTGNLRRLGGAGPDARWTDAEISRLVTRIIRNWGRCVVDAMYLARASDARIDALVGSLAGGEHLDAALAAGKGVMLVTPHLGHWELGGAVVARNGYPFNVVSAVVPDESVRRIKHGFRERLGIKHLYMDDPSSPSAMLGVLAALRNNEIVAMLPDRDSGAEQTAVQYCGDRARFPIGPAWLAVRTGAALLPAYVVRGSDGRYTARAEAPIFAPTADPDDRRAAADDLTQQLATRFEAIVSRFPDQWYNFFPSWVRADAEAPA